MKEGLEEAIAYTKGQPNGAKKTVVTVRPLPQYEAKEIRSIRQNLGLTQAAFAGLMGVSRKTVEAWETGTNIPQGSSRRLLEIISQHQDMVKDYVSQ